MAHIDDGARLGASLGAWLAEVSFTDRDADQVTELLVAAVLAWGTDQGWRVYRRARSVLPLPPPYADRHSWVDVACARRDAAPVVVEVDRSDRRRTVDKLLAEAAAGRVALWVRWGRAPFAPPPPPVHLVGCPVDARRDASGGRVFSARSAPRPAPSHSGIELGAAEQADLFGSG